MPLPLLPLLALGSGITSTGINALSQQATNRQNRNFSREMYWRQREDSLADWNMQNEYNSPAAQMDRLMSAGLNPNLVYGNGATAMSGQMPRSANAPAANAQAPQVDLQSGFMGYADIMMKTNQADLVAEQKKLVAEQALLASMNQMKVATEIDKNKLGAATMEYDLMMKNMMQDINLQYGQLRNTKLSADITFTLDENERKEVQLGRNVIESVERVLNYQLSRTKDQAEIERIQQATELLRKDNRVREYAARLADKGLDPNSPAYIKMVESLINWLRGGKTDRTLPYLSGDETDSFGRPRGGSNPPIRKSDYID